MKMKIKFSAYVPNVIDAMIVWTPKELGL